MAVPEPELRIYKQIKQDLSQVVCKNWSSQNSALMDILSLVLFEASSCSSFTLTPTYAPNESVDHYVFIFYIMDSSLYRKKWPYKVVYSAT